MVEIPGDIIAPNNYSFVLAIWAKEIVVCDLIEDVCHFRVHDNGSDYAIYEGIDYGNFIIKPIWTKC